MIFPNASFCPLIIFDLIAIVRMNFSHGSYEYHQSVIDNTRKMVARKWKGYLRDDEIISDVEHLPSEDPTGRPVAIALDTVCCAFFSGTASTD